MRIVCISDTHSQHSNITDPIPEGDVLVHAGDFTGIGLEHQIKSFDEWIGSLPHRHKIVIAGGHDLWSDVNLKERASEILASCTYLDDSEFVIQGLRFYGTSLEPPNYDWCFSVENDELIRSSVDKIPSRTDVVITHLPPLGIRDQIIDGTSVGSSYLRQRILLIEPKVHIFGHIHEGYGQEQRGKTIFVNAATCDIGYKPANGPIIIDL